MESIHTYIINVFAYNDAFYFRVVHKSAGAYQAYGFAFVLVGDNEIFAIEFTGI